MTSTTKARQKTAALRGSQDQPSTNASISIMRFVVAGFVWLLIAIALGASGVLQRIKPPAPQLIIIGLVIAMLAAYATTARFREWLRELDLRALIALHLTRFVGFYFLYLYRKGQLPRAFAIPAGWGDIVIATFALVLLVAWSRVGRQRGALLLWNALVVADAAKQALVDPASMSALLRLPLSLLVTFFVPLIIGSHLLIFARLRIRK
jgi:hypothetical protein